MVNEVCSRLTVYVTRTYRNKHVTLQIFSKAFCNQILKRTARFWPNTEDLMVLRIKCFIQPCNYLVKRISWFWLDQENHVCLAKTRGPYYDKTKRTICKWIRCFWPNWGQYFSHKTKRTTDFWPHQNDHMFLIGPRLPYFDKTKRTVCKRTTSLWPD